MKIWIQAEFGDDIHIFIHIMLFGIIIKTYKIPSAPKKIKKKKKKEKQNSKELKLPKFYGKAQRKENRILGV